MQLQVQYLKNKVRLLSLAMQWARAPSNSYNSATTLFTKLPKESTRKLQSSGTATLPPHPTSILSMTPCSMFNFQPYPSQKVHKQHLI
jgi:hypothetical protein